MSPRSAIFARNLNPNNPWQASGAIGHVRQYWRRPESIAMAQKQNFRRPSKFSDCFALETLNWLLNYIASG